MNKEEFIEHLQGRTYAFPQKEARTGGDYTSEYKKGFKSAIRFAQLEISKLDEPEISVEKAWQVIGVEYGDELLQNNIDYIKSNGYEVIKKPVVPQFVADFIGRNIGLSCALPIDLAIYLLERYTKLTEEDSLTEEEVFKDGFTEELGNWLSENMPEFCMACANGYKIEKLKFYLMPVPYQKSDQVFYWGVGDNIQTKWSIDRGKHHQYTQEELDKYFPEIKHMAIEVEDE